MLRPHEKRRLKVGVTLSLVFWAISTGFFLLIWDIGRDPGLLSYALHWVLAFLAGYCLVFVFWFFPVFVVVAVMKLRDQKRIELEELGDENKVFADPDGQRKLHEYLTAINSTEARIGLLQRSEPWPGEAPPPAPEGPVWRLSGAARAILPACVAIGFVVGIALGAARMAGMDGAELSVTLKRTLLARLLVSGLLGALFASPLGWIAVLLFGKTEPVETPPAEEDDDTGRSGPETA